MICLPAELVVLVCAPTGKDTELIVSTLAAQGIVCEACADLDGVLRRAKQGAGALLVSEESVSEAPLARLAEWIGTQPPWSELPVLVLTEPGVGSLQAMQLLETLGNVSLLERPTRVVALVSAVCSALRARKRQYQLRGHLKAQVRALEALHTSEERLRLATEAAGMAVWDHDLATGRLIWSERHFQIFGYPPQRADQPIDPRLWRDRVHRNDLDRVLGRIEEARATHGTFRDEYRIVRAGDGAVRWIRPFGRYEYDEGGQPTRFLGVLFDSTELKKEGQLLRERTWLLEAVANATTDMIYVKDLEGRFVMANPSFADLVGPETQIVGSTDWEVQPSEERAHRIVANDARIVASGGTEVIEEQFGSLAGEITVLSTKTPMRDELGRVIGLVGISRDITERKRMESSLRESEALYRSIGDSIDYGIWISDAEGRTRYASESFLAMLGLSQEECTDPAAAASKLHPEDVEATVRSWNESLASGATWDREHRFLGVDGKYHHVLSRGVAVRDADGNVSSWVGINLDIDRQKSAEQSLIEANQKKDEFLASLAHELRNPLAPIRSAVKLMRNKKKPDPDLSWAHDVVERQVKQLARLVDDLLDISRITRGTIAIFPEETDLAAVVRMAVETSLPHIQNAGLQLHIDLPPTPVPLHVDPVRIAQILSNLLNNAAKYTPPAGSIWIDASSEGDEVTIRVRDTGVGIDAAMLPRIFDLFMQQEGPLAAREGLGIGLTLARRFVELHGGSIEGFSEGAGKGSEFVVRFPRRSAALDALQKTEPRDGFIDAAEPIELRTMRFDPNVSEIASGGSARPTRVLVVDDNEDNANSLGMLLETLHYDVRIAHDGRQAIDLAESFDPTIVLMDIGLPTVDGYDAARSIRQQPGGEGRLLIAVTGWGREEDRRRSREAGYDYHLVKPISFEALQKIIEKFALDRT